METRTRFGRTLIRYLNHNFRIIAARVSLRKRRPRHCLMDLKLTAENVNKSYTERNAVSVTEVPPGPPSPESSSLCPMPSRRFLIPKQKTGRTVYHLCKRLMRPMQMELLLLAKRDLSRWHEELQNFHCCIRRLGRHLQACLRKFCNLQDREVWEINLWEYVSLYAIFDGWELRILYHDSKTDFNTFKVTYEKLRFNFLATQLLIGSCDLQQLYGAWGLCGACTCPDCGPTSPSCAEQIGQLWRVTRSDVTGLDRWRGPLKAATSGEQERPNTTGQIHTSEILKRGTKRRQPRETGALAIGGDTPGGNSSENIMGKAPKIALQTCS